MGTPTCRVQRECNLCRAFVVPFILKEGTVARRRFFEIETGFEDLVGPYDFEMFSTYKWDPQILKARV